jgi:hypothetical protein
MAKSETAERYVEFRRVKSKNEGVSRTKIDNYQVQNVRDEGEKVGFFKFIRFNIDVFLETIF